MCGIVGFFGKQNTDLLYKMTSKISHRGPDQDIKFEKQNINIGFRRLSINDLSNGDQPFYDLNRKIGVFCNGEIYNHKELRKNLEEKKYQFKTKSDCEVILHGYAEYGLEFLNKINGMFFILIWNEISQTIYLVRDRLGIKPCYYANIENQIYFSSEIKPLLENQKLKKTINHNSIDYYLSNRYVPSTHNLIKEIKTLKQGTILEIKNDSVKNIQYWDCNQKNENVENNLNDILNRSVDLRMSADVKVGVFLSGGLDSSIITSLMSKKSKNFEIFTHSYNRKFDESSYAEKLCNNLGLVNLNIIEIKKEDIWNLENIVGAMEFPIGNSDIIGLDLLCKAAKQKNTKVILSGEGADEIFGSYVHHNVINKIQKIKNIINYLKLNKPTAMALKIIPKDIMNLFFNYGKYKITDDLKMNLRNFFYEKSELKSYFNLISLYNSSNKKDLYNDNFRDLINKNNYNFEEDDEINLLYKVLRFEIKNWLPSYHLLKEDKISMSHSIEMRFPFLDHNLYEFINAQKKDNYIANEKLFLKKSFSGIIPDFITNRKKGPILVPIIETFGKEFTTMYRDYLTEKSIKSSNLFNYQYLNELFNNYENNKDYILANKIFAVLCLQIWIKKFIS